MHYLTQEQIDKIASCPPAIKEAVADLGFIKNSASLVAAYLIEGKPTPEELQLIKSIHEQYMKLAVKAISERN